MKYKYDIKTLEMELHIQFPQGEKIRGKNLSWNIFINDTNYKDTAFITVHNDGNSKKFFHSFGNSPT